MYLLARTVSKHHKPCSDWLFNLILNNITIKLTETKIKQLKQVCNCVVYNISKSISKGSDSLIVPLDKTLFTTKPIINGQQSKGSPIDYKMFKLFLEAGCFDESWSDYMDVFKGQTFEQVANEYFEVIE